MYKRKKIVAKRRDQKYFSRTAQQTRNKNLRVRPMRGGFRI